MSACGVPEGEGEDTGWRRSPFRTHGLLTEPCIVNLLRMVLVYLFPGVVAERRPAGGARIARARTRTRPAQAADARSVFLAFPRERKLQLLDEPVGHVVAQHAVSAQAISLVLLTAVPNR